MYTKKNLGDRFGISKNTVYETIKACGLDTAKTTYTEEEIQTRFTPARQLLDSGQATYESLREYFDTRSAEVGSEPPASSGAQTYSEQVPTEDSMDMEPFVDVVRQELTQSVELLIEAATSDVVKLVSYLTARSLLSSTNRGEIARALQEGFSAEARRILQQRQQRSITLNSPPKQLNGIHQAFEQARQDFVEVSPQPESPDVMVDWGEEDDLVSESNTDIFDSVEPEVSDEPSFQN